MTEVITSRSLPSEIWRMSATQVAALIRSKGISAQEAAASALARLDSVNAGINAVIDHRPDEVMRQARQTDDAIARGDVVGSLAGVPVTVKVNIDMVSHATTNGTVLQRDLIAKTNSPIVDNLRKAGATILGRTNTPAFSLRWFTSNRVHGETFNPRDRSLTPGGSSGGAAAATAAGIGHIAHGTDIAGSIRYPAYACGIHGLRPSLGRVAAFNASAPERSIGGQIMAVSGPIARTVDDLRLGLAAMSAPDARDPWWVPATLIGPDVSRIAAVCTHPDGMDTAPQIVKALLEASDRLRDAGWTIVQLDELPAIRSVCDAQIKLWMGDGFEAMLRAATSDGDAGAIAALSGQSGIARGLSLQGFSDALKIRATATRAWQLFFERFAVALLPVSAELPFDANLDLRDDASYERCWRAQSTMIGLPMTGMPCMSLATGEADGRPIGIQIVAGRFREDLCLSVGEAIESRSPKVRIALAD
jgi:amidase